jgi:hypothetical protein
MTKIAYSFLVCCFISSNLIGQNLIADPSFENFGECPQVVSFPEFGFETWEIFRGTPNIHSECSMDFPLGWNSGFGYQASRTGLTHIGFASYFDVWQAREYPATELLDSLEIGQEYYVEFHVSLAYNFNVTMFKSNNLGVLLMTENYLTLEIMDPAPNFAHLNVDTMISDTLNWVKLYGHIVADSAYKYLAIGNFFDDSLTTYEFGFDEIEDGITAYYFLDDVCISADSALCGEILSSPYNKIEKDGIRIFPNPVFDHFSILSDQNGYLENLSLLNMSGMKVYEASRTELSSLVFNIDNIQSGLYIVNIRTADGQVYVKKVIVQ